MFECHVKLNYRGIVKQSHECHLLVRKYYEKYASVQTRQRPSENYLMWKGTSDRRFNIYLKWKAEGLELHGRLQEVMFRGGKPQPIVLSEQWLELSLRPLRGRSGYVFSLFNAQWRATSGKHHLKLICILPRIPKKIQYARWSRNNWSRTKELPRGWSWGDPTVLQLTKASLPRCIEAGVQVQLVSVWGKPQIKNNKLYTETGRQFINS